MRTIKHYLNVCQDLMAERICNRLGYTTNKHLIVVESDDWGSVRMPSRDVYNKLLNEGIRVDKCHYCHFDSIETSQDIIALQEVLSGFKDYKENPLVITANFVMNNPDFEKIQSDNFKIYHNQSIVDSYKRYSDSDTLLTLKETIKMGFVKPQLHGREHLNVLRWLQYLQNGSKETLIAFQHSCFGLSTTIVNEKRDSFLAELDARDFKEEHYIEQAVQQAAADFETVFGRQSRSFIAPNYTWNKDLNSTLADLGIEFIQGRYKQSSRNLKSGECTAVYHYMGEKNKWGQIYLIRNCNFEPSSNRQIDWIDKCLAEIKFAFDHKRPAIISSHRVNFMGGIYEKNREQTLIAFKSLFSRIIKAWPDVEFLSSDQLGELIKSE